MLAVITVFSIVSPAISQAEAAGVADVGSLWDGFTSGTGNFTVTSDSRVFVVAAKEPTGDLLQTAQLIHSQMKDEFDLADMKFVWGAASEAKQGDIVLVLDTASGIGADGYKLNVTSTTATVTAADTDGLIYGANNLMKCFRAVGSNSISCFSGNDTPDTKERTVHLDLARKYYTVEWVKNFIKQMSWMGYNAIELHTSEDGGFRADLWDEEYYTDNYQPENDFSWLAGSHLQYWVYSPYNKDPDAGKYLTTAELVEICNVAKEYHVEVIPSFDSPAHMDYITWKFEQHYKSNKNYYFSYEGKDYYASDTNGCINYKGVTGGSAPNGSYTTMELNDSITRGQMAKAFIFAIYEDMADFFKEYAGSTKFMIGADEVGLSSSTWKYSDFVEYVNELNTKLNNKGYTVRMYNDFIGSTTYNYLENGKAIYGADAENGFARNIEICYWNSDFEPTSGSHSQPVWHVKFFWENNTGSNHNWGDGGRVLYNAIQTNTYYVLRYAHGKDNADARDPDNRQWTFYGTNEQDIYNNWYPADISEKGDYTEDAADVPENQLGGAYFLIWNDYAALNTESEVWNGALDTHDKDRYYYLFDIMASNIIKMWNSDINSTVSYSEFAEVRNAITGNGMKFFPGFTSCSAPSDLAAAAPITKAEDVVDHTPLTNAIKAAEALDENAYTPSSWAAFETAIAEAKKVDNNQNATAADITNAVNALKAAQTKLVEKADKTALQQAVDNAIAEQGNYTDDSWSDYQQAVVAAEAVLANGDATQKQVDDALAALIAADEALEEKGPGSVTDPTDPPVQGEESEDITIRKIVDKTPVGKKVGLVIIAPADSSSAPVVTLNGKQVTLTLCITNIQKLDGENVRVWMIDFPAEKVGTYTCKITIDGVGYKTTDVIIK